jgi:hypothetical protein
MPDNSANQPFVSGSGPISKRSRNPPPPATIAQAQAPINPSVPLSLPGLGGFRAGVGSIGMEMTGGSHRGVRPQGWFHVGNHQRESGQRRHFELNQDIAIQAVVYRFEIRVSTRSGPDEAAQSVGRAAQLSRNVDQPNHVLDNQLAGRKTKRRPRAGEVGLAMTQHHGMEVDSVFINKARVG